MVTLSAMEEQVRASVGPDLLNRSVCLLVSMHKLGDHRTVRREKINRASEPAEKRLPFSEEIPPETPRSPVQIDADPEMVRVQKVLFKSPEYDAICRFDRKIAAYLKTRCLPSLLRKGAYLLPIPLVKEVDQMLTNFAAQRKELVRILAGKFTQIVEESEKPLGGLFNRKDYPTPEELDELFSMVVRYITFGVPENLKEASRSIFQREQDKAQAMWAEATEEVRQVLRVGLAEFVDRMINGLTPRSDGKKKTLRANLLNRITDFLGTFAARNITNDAELAELVDRAKALLTGVDAKSLSDNQDLRAAVQNGFNEVKKSLNTLVGKQPTRRIVLSDEEEV
jgi:hypothetical protein